MKVRWRVVGVVLLAASLAAGFSTLLSYQVEASRATAGRTPNVANLAILNSTFWFGWVALALPLGALVSRFRIDRRPRAAVPVFILAIVGASVVHVALQTAAQVNVYWRALVASTDKAAVERLATFNFGGEWLKYYPIQLTSLIDWEIITGAAIVGITHAVFYYRESQRRSLETAHLQTRLVEAQLQALQSQLHPHFLFNTLHAISALMHRDVQAADRMLTQLSDLLRMTLDLAHHPEVRLDEEME